MKELKKCDLNIIEALSIVEKMLKLAEQGDNEREDTGCGVMYGMIRDSVYKIRQLAEKEKQVHMAKGWWDESLN